MEAFTLDETLARWAAEAQALAERAAQWMLAPTVLAQLALAAAVILAAILAGRVLRRRAEPAVAARLDSGVMRHVARIGLRALPWLVAFALLGLAVGPFRRIGAETAVIDSAATLVVAWIAVRTLARLILNPVLSRAMALTVFAVIALEIVGLLTPLGTALDRLAVEFGEVRLSALGVVQGIALLIAMLWLARLVSALVEGWLRPTTSFSPAMQVLAVKLVRVTLIAIAIVVALSAMGVDLTAFAVFSGALGVGLGFGLQKVVSNLISGFILLMDRSIKPGDVIETEGTYGAITRLHARYVSIVTRENTEYLIPNEDLITQRVINWSFSSDLIRLSVPIGISYDSDVRLAMRLCIEAAEVVERVVSQPKPRCLMRGFGESSVDLELRFWIRDPANGTRNVSSDVLLGVWDRFHEHGIRIPFPQRDLHLRSAEAPMPVTVTQAKE